MAGLVLDIRYGLRQLRKTPGITTIAIVTLALGIGANTAIFTVLNAILLRPLPYEDPSQLVWITNYLPKMKDSIVGTPDFVQWQKQNHCFARLAAYDEGDFNLTGGPGPERVHFAGVTASFLPLLGIQPAAGRVFVNSENAPGSTPVVILSHGIWKRRFGGDRSVIGTKIQLDGISREVIGVTPANFVFPDNESSPDVLVPFVVPEHLDMASRNIEIVNVVGRLRPHVTVDQARAEISAIQHAFVDSAYPSGFRNMANGFETRVVSLQEHLAGDVRHTLLLLLAAVGFLLVIACANTANLQVTTLSARSKELGVRAAMGARPARLARQLLIQSVLLSGLGGLAGLFLAFWLIVVLHRFHPQGLPHFNEIGVDYSVLTFALIVAMLSGILSGLVPAIFVRHRDLSESLNESSQTVTDVRSVRSVRKLLVVSEVSLAVVLLIGSGLFIRSFVGLLRVDPGFEPHALLTLQISLPEAKYSDPTQQRAFFESLIHRLSTLPGVVRAGVVSQLPLTGYQNTGSVVIEGQPAAPPGMRPWVPIASATTDYFRTMGLPVTRGRYFDSTDSRRSPGVVLISKAFAQQFFPGVDAIGKRIQLGGSTAWLTIVGVVGDVRHIGLEAPPDREVFTSFQQSPAGEMAVVLRAATDPLALTSGVRHEVLALDQEQPIFDIATMQQRLTDSIAAQRFTTWCLTAFGVIALLLAAIGIYGVVSFFVVQRTHEIGIRMALGAEQHDVLRLVLKVGTMLVVAGIAIGILAAFALTRFLSGMLFGIRPNDVATFATASIVLAVVAGLGGYIPARRAAKVDPMVALRYE